MHADYGATDWAGYTIVHSSPPWCGGSATDASVLINDYWVRNYDYTHRRHVGGHELGHALTLDHPPADYVSMMVSGGYQYWYVQQHEKDDMQARYPR